MSGPLAVIGVAAALFIATNVDEIFVLVAFFADPAYRPRQVVLGQLAGMAALVALSLAGSLLGLVVPAAYLGLLGVVPFAIGVWKLRGDDDEEPVRARAGSRVLAVALVVVANGGDNLGAYIPVFATRTAGQLVAIIAVFLALTLALCAFAHALVTHPRVGPTVRRIARPATPLVLMAIGIWITVESGAYRLFW